MSRSNFAIAEMTLIFVLLAMQAMTRRRPHPDADQRGK
jgi:hypothetical protein